jgi:hypothetical protein
MTLEFLKNETMVSNCSQAVMALTSRGCPGYSQDMPKKLHLAAYFGLPKAMTSLINSGYGADPKNSWNQTLLDSV